MSAVFTRRRGALVALAWVCACASEDPGIAPPRDGFYFPTGLALDRTRPMLYVSNSNADLRHNGGTLTALDIGPLPLDLSRIGEAAAGGSGRSCERRADCPPGETCGDGRCVALDCRPDRIDPTRWECPEEQFVQPSATVRIGDFPAEVRVDDDGGRLFVPVRGQNHLAWVDVVPLADSECLALHGRTGCVDLRCNDNVESGCAAAGGRDCPAWDCDSGHLVNYSERRRDTLPAEPFGIHWQPVSAVHVDDEGRRRTCQDGISAVSCSCGDAPRCDDEQLTGCCFDPPAADQVFVAHIAGGEVSFFSSDANGVELMDFSGGFFNPESGIRGGFALAPAIPGDAESPVYVSSRVDSAIASFVIRDNARIIRSRRIGVGGVAPGNDVRGIAFAPGGEVLYAISRLPPALVALDMTEDEEGVPAADPLWAVEVCGEPSVVRLGGDPRRVGDPTARLAYVVCFEDAQIDVVDTTLAQVVARIATGSGPNAFELDERNRRAFVANFAENTVGVVDLDPAHATYLKMVLRIGMARRPERG